MSRPQDNVTRLVVCDTYDAAWLRRARDAVRPGGRWKVLVLGVSAEVYSVRHRDALAALDGVEVLDAAALAPAANTAAARFVLDLIHRLPELSVGRRTLGAALAERDRNLWWYLELTEKSAFRGRLVERLFRLAMIDGVLASGAVDEVWIESADAALGAVVAGASDVPRVRAPQAPPGMSAAAFTVAYWSRALAAVARFAGVRAVLAGARWPSMQAGRASLAVFTLYPFWWLQPFSSAPVERFFSAPPEGTCYLAWITWPRQVWRHRRPAKAAGQRLRIVPLQRHVAWTDALRVLSPARFGRLLQVRREAASHLSVRFGRFDVSPLVAEELAVSMSDSELFFDQLVETSLAAVLERAKPSTLLYRVEGQPWEHALLAAARRTRTPVQGLFHSPFGENYPALRFAAGEIRDTGPAGRRPRPDRMLTCGSVGRRLLEADGYPGDEIAACGPQRHAAFVRRLSHRPGRRALRARLRLPLDAPVYYVAPAIVEQETEGLFVCLAGALDPRPDARVLVKTHPNRPAGDAALRAAVAAIGGARVIFVPPGGDMYEYLAASDLMIGIGSTLAFEAMALDVLPVIYEHPGTFAATSLRAFTDALYVVASPAAMRQAIAEIVADAPPAAARRRRFAPAVAGVFGDLRTPLDQQLLDAVRGAPVRARAAAH